MLTISGYHIGEHLHTGAASTVYRARRNSDDQPVVLKIVGNDPERPERLAWFQREYQVTRSLQLPGVIQAYTLEVTPSHWVMVLEDCEAEALTRLGLAGTLSLIDFFKLAIGVTAVLQQLHAQRFIHRQINPAHILFNPASRQVTLIDLGMATDLVSEIPVPGHIDRLLGTVPYLAPEQTGHMPPMLDYRTDLYALGITLYELLTGQLPFDSQDAVALSNNSTSRALLAPHVHKPGIPPILSDIILKLLAQKADARYPSASSLKADLAECLRQLETHSYIVPFVPGQQVVETDLVPEAPSALDFPSELAGRSAELTHLQQQLDAEVARRQRAEQSLHTSQELLQSFIDHAPTAIFAKDRQERYMLANDLAAASMHLTAAELIGKTAADLFPPDVAAAAQRYEQQVIDTEQEVVCEQQVPLPDGLHTYLVTRFPLYNQQNELYAIGAIATDITRRKQAEEALHASQLRLKAIFDNAAVGMVLVNLQGYALEVNQTWLDLLGCTAADISALTLLDIIFSEDREAHRQAWEELQQATMLHYRHETRFLRLDGRIFWGDLSLTPIRNEQNELEAILAVIADISERKQVEETLQLARFALDHSADEILWIGEDKRFLYANDAACRILGYTRDELLTMTIADINPIFPMEIWADHWQKMQQQGFTKLETQHRRKDGSTFPVEVTSTYLEHHGRAYLCSFIRDISERKQAEETLRKWADIFQNIKIGVVVSDVGSTNLDLMNPAFASMYGYTVEELTGQPVAALYAPDAHAIYERSARLVQEQEHVVFEAQHQRKDGSIFPVLVDVTVIQRGTDLVPYRIANIQDLTERKQAETQLLEQHKALTMLRERERLARELHDNLGQVLGYIKTQAQATRDLLASGDVTTADAYLTQMITASQENHTDIREFILGATARATLDQGFFATLRHYLERFGQLYGIAVDLEVTPDLNDQSFAPATDVQLLRIIQEALTNIRKHAHTHAAQISFTCTTDQVRIVVADAGRGFDPQSTSMKMEPTDGQHYGLSSMRERASEIGAHLRIEAHPGAGTQVIVQLPRHVCPKRTLTSLRVLLVDDHPLFLQGMQNLLTGRGIAVIGTANDGIAALNQARALRPDLILMDIEMPNCNGLQATRLIKAELPDIQIVMLTMSEHDTHLFEAIRYGASGYLLKGLDSDQFFILLTNVMEGETVISPGLAARVLAEFVHQEHPWSPVPAPSASAPGAGNDAHTPGTIQLPTPIQTQDVDVPMPQIVLSERQIEVLSLVAQGYTYQEIGDMLHLSKHTVRYHMREIISQLHFKNRAEIIAFAQQMGFMQES